MRLYLVVETRTNGGNCLELDGRYWTLQPFELAETPTADPVAFLCISYTWGPGREPSPFHAGFEVSDRTVPALRTAARARPHLTKIWIDAFCVPPGPPRERYACLESMGFIYSRASEVLVVLSPAARPALDNILETDRPADGDLAALEDDDWVTRAWTYQEAVNARALFFTSNGDDSTNTTTGAAPVIGGEIFLNRVGYALTHMPLTPLERRGARPRLDAFEDVLEYLVAEYEGRSALQVMAIMDRRRQLRPEDHFYAMVGAVSRLPASSAGAGAGADACEAFMRVCERKGDYSFVFSAAPRCAEPRRRWRPRVGDLPAVLQLPCCGRGQPGVVREGRLVLSQVVALELGPLGEKARGFVSSWLKSQRVWNIDHAADLPGGVLTALRLYGFQGEGVVLESREGFFFATHTIQTPRLLLVSASLPWIFGAPGLVLASDGTSTLYTAGVFVGLVNEHAGRDFVLD
ncbi:hypothetical protein GGTG_02247 [Gaeumannomyces tritici R3-111a-1]|uniref:Heterokaryon incompatibility domain-containing protein n=1 Tax=Gaeumannomyces tritici (strain R3-111a-1) TaxID=644352 RepID=J3NLU7_GAET3|nr:hypothetical protein GGTG_02247 [Gaeumannomyces tritici R3-111a-1]EJT82273.1 hypothetical protein GGTG_02247 [Gaeumannomyces tritici R3-111a-1]